MSTDNATWTRCDHHMPPLGEVVNTKIDDEQGSRNAQPLKRYRRDEQSRSLWFYPDGSMYVYYTPTHWQRIPNGK